MVNEKLYVCNCMYVTVCKNVYSFYIGIHSLINLFILDILGKVRFLL